LGRYGSSSSAISSGDSSSSVAASASSRCPSFVAPTIGAVTPGLKRRCLYLWLDYPTIERELEIVHLHAPELDERIARKLVEVIHMVRSLDLKKPPSIAESIDWARALLLLGAEDVDQAVLQKTMSIIVKHRTDLDLVAERVGVKLGDGLFGTRQAG
jgi:MoxR-like ATPase